MKIGTYEVPFAPDGSLLHYHADSWENKCGPRWGPNKEFVATLTFSHLNTGRSAKYVTLVGDDGKTYPMFVADLLDMIKRADISKGTIRGIWKPRKRGTNYGIVYMGPSE